MNLEYKNDEIYVYCRGGQLRALTYIDASIKGKRMTNIGWVHTATVDPKIWMLNLLNLPQSKMMEEINKLKTK